MGNFVFWSSSSLSPFLFVHRLFFHSSANPYSFFGCTHAMLFRMTFACIIFHLNIFVRFEYETILFASYVTTFMRFIFFSVQFLVSMKFVQIFVWMVKSFLFFAAFSCCFESENCNKRAICIRAWHLTRAYRFVRYIYKMVLVSCWMFGFVSVNQRKVKRKNEKNRFRNETHGH